MKAFFGDFDDALLARLLPLLEWVEVSAGESLFRRGDIGEHLYFVVSGCLRDSPAF